VIDVEVDVLSQSMPDEKTQERIMVTTGAVSGSSAQAAADAQSQAFRNADFLKIMLSELANQDPLKPQETSKIVENMQKLQELANSQYEKFRADISWAQDLLGKTVNVQQMSISDVERQSLVNQGVRPDVGFNNLDGEVSGFRQVGEVVYVSIGEHDYPVDNIKQVRPQKFDPNYLAGLANDLLGLNVGFKREDGTQASGKVSDVAYDAEGEVLLNINGEAVPYRSILKIGLAQP
jgi:Flagellar hook capping protein - N-terminal region